MAIWNQKSILKTAVDDWQSRGLIDTTTAVTLSSDIGQTTSSFAFRNILILLAVICLGFAAMTFVAANWDEMTRLTRVGIIFAAMWASWGASAVFLSRGQSWFAQIFTLGACAMFGAGIMLISQIYHIQGNPADAVWLWAIGTILAAGLTRSIPALCLSIALFFIWMNYEWNFFGRDFDLHFDFPIYMAACAALAYWMKTRFAAHLIVLATCYWALGIVFIQLDQKSLMHFSIVLGTAFSVLSLMLYSDRVYLWLRGFERAVAFYIIGVLGVLVTAWHFISIESRFEREMFPLLFDFIPAAVIATAICCILAALAFRRKHENTYDLVATAIFAAITFGLILFAPGTNFTTEALMLAGSIWIIRMGWRIEYRPIAALGFIAFGGAMLLIYFETIGSLLGTSIFYLVAGVMLLTGVFLIPRLTKTAGADK
jgi:uncharacterized membrane protein